MKHITIYVYKVTNNINNKYYIGVHKQYINKPDTYMGSGKAIKSAIKKYGKVNFTKTILKEFDNYSDALIYEKELVTEEEVKDSNCYNLMVGGKGGSTMLGKKMSDQTKQKIRQSLKGKPGNNIGVKWSEHTKQKMSNAKKGKKLTKEHSLKISKSNKGKTSNRKGIHMSDTQKLKISQALKGRKLSKEHKNKKTKNN